MTSSLIFVAAVLLIPSIQSIEGKILKCPTISNGYHPFCECRYGPKYDEATNTCPNPECPAYNSTGVYPNCTCNHKNFDYSIFLNECVRVCPEDSTGYWPNCNCDADGYVFDKIKFKCIRCPLNSTGVYPKCMCSKDSVYDEHSNLCERCEGGSVGIYPNCTCIYDKSIRQCKVRKGCIKTDVNFNYEDIFKTETNDEEYSEKDDDNDSNEDSNTEDDEDYYEDDCVECPFDSTGVYPNCICKKHGMYIALGNYCLQCPWKSYGAYPNCTCKKNGTYIGDVNSCYRCPRKSIGKYPDCICPHPFQYEIYKKKCVKCPENISGIYPNCTCTNGYFSRYHQSCIECPEHSTGFYPKCECLNEDHVFSAFINKCYIPCPENSIGKHPDCTCDDGHYYVVNEFNCKSNVGRKCPLESIGVGPDCLCVLEEMKFDRYLWECIHKKSALSSFAAMTCPGYSGKWPQCEASIDQNVRHIL